MSIEEWEKKVLETPGAAERVREIEDELRLATALTALREQAGLSQRELAERLGVSQPRIAAIERSRNVTIDVLEHYARRWEPPSTYQWSRAVDARSCSAPASRSATRQPQGQSQQQGTAKRRSA